MQKRRVYLESIGCRLNAAESEILACHFVGAGYTVVHRPEDAELVVLNTCAVTAEAARKSRSRLRALQRRSPQAALAAVGCWVEFAAETAQSLPGVRWAIPNADKDRTVALVTGESVTPVPWSPGIWSHTRAFVGVQYGCDSACTYCITRVLRGPGRSQPLAETVAQVRDFVRHGAQEVVLTGVSLGAYGHDLGLKSGLAQLVEAILRDTDVPRLRLSSIEPWDVDAALLQQWAHPRLCRQLHLPLQAGSDAILRRMGRRVTTAEFAAVVDHARVIAPDIAITTDVMTGFPGETVADFEAGLDFVTRMEFTRLHVFPFSEREGTPAARLPGRVPKAVRAARAARMRALGARLADAYRARFVGRVLPVLWEQQDRLGRWHGLTDTYLEVLAETSENLHNRILPARLGSMMGAYLWAEVDPATDMGTSEGETTS